jgi:hypothetical protein
MIRLHAAERFHNPDFFLGVSDAVIEDSDKLVARGIIHASVNCDLTYNLLDLLSASNVYFHLVSKFRIVNRAAQLQAWNKLVSVDPSQHTTTASLYERFANLGKTFTEQGLSLSWEDMIGLIMQNNLKESIRQAVNQKVALFMESRDYELPSLQDMLQFIDATRTKQKLAEASRMTETHSLHVHVPSRTSSSTMRIEDTQAIEARAVNKTTRCYICNRPDHLAPDCPNKRQGQSTRPGGPAGPNQRGSAEFPPCSVTYNFDKMPYIRPMQPEQARQSSGPRITPPNQKKTTDSADSSKVVAARMINPDLFANDEEECETFEQESLSTKPVFDRFNIRKISVDKNSQEVLWDSGTSDNVTGDRYALHDFQLLKHPIPVKVATDAPCNYITGTGTLRFCGMNSTIIAVKGVFFCEQARSTLLSLGAFKKANARFHVTSNFDLIDLLSQSGKLLLNSNFDAQTNSWPLAYPLRIPHAPLHVLPANCNEKSPNLIAINLMFKSPNLVKGSQFTWNPEELTLDEKSLLFWHRLFGHASLWQIRRLVELKLGYGLPEEMPTGSIKCPVCAICKATRTSTLGPSNCCSEKLSVVCVDLMGPFDPPTMTGGKYAMTIRDTFTSYSEVKILKAKLDSTTAIIQTITLWETQTRGLLKILRSNNGREFESKILAEYLAGKGAIAERLLPYRHFQNGAAERYNRTVADMGRSVLYNSKMSKQFWGYAFLWAAWTLNRIPNKTSGPITPYKCFYGNKPQLDRTWVFGSKAYVLVAPKKRKKLDERAIEGLVIGHLEESKGWTVWIPSTKKLGPILAATAYLCHRHRNLYKTKCWSWETSGRKRLLRSKKPTSTTWVTFPLRQNPLRQPVFAPP